MADIKERIEYLIKDFDNILIYLHKSPLEAFIEAINDYADVFHGIKLDKSKVPDVPNIPPPPPPLLFKNLIALWEEELKKEIKEGSISGGAYNAGRITMLGEKIKELIKILIPQIKFIKNTVCGPTIDPELEKQAKEIAKRTGMSPTDRERFSKEISGATATIKEISGIKGKLDTGLMENSYLPVQASLPLLLFRYNQLKEELAKHGYKLRMKKPKNYLNKA